MIGAAVVIVLAGLVFPITMLFLALLFDAVVVVWTLFQVWHDDWSPKLVRFATRAGERSHVAFGHRPASRPAH